MWPWPYSSLASSLSGQEKRGEPHHSHSSEVHLSLYVHRVAMQKAAAVMQGLVTSYKSNCEEPGKVESTKLIADCSASFEDDYLGL